MTRSVSTVISMAALVSVALVGAAPMAQAQINGEGRVPTRTVVKVDKVDFNDPAKVAGLYRSLRNQARTLCQSDDVRYDKQDKLCAQEAVAKAVQDVNQPALSAMHDATSAGQAVYADKGGRSLTR